MTTPSPALLPTIAIIATLDTKADEAAFVAREIRAEGCAALLVDVGLAGSPPIPADITREQVAQAGGMRSQADKSDRMTAMRDGAAALLARLVDQRQVSAVVGLGGGQGSWLSSGVMRSLPIGLPKVLISTAGRHIGEFVGSSDILAVFSVTDLAGLNSVDRPILRNAAKAVSGMARAWAREDSTATRSIAMTMYGITTPGAVVAKSALERTGYEVLPFHANGVGGEAMERLISHGRLTAVLDWSITELADELLGGICSAGPDRLTAAAAYGLPQVIVPGGLDVVNFAQRGTVPPRYADRVFYQHTPDATLMRTSAEDNARLGSIVAGKLQHVSAATTIMVPLYGFSILSAPGQPLADPAADRAFIESLRAEASPDLEIVEVPASINEPAFADAAAKALLRRLTAGADCSCPAVPQPPYP
jgi:uncharacterized protein (UPF0261 family)